MSKPAKKPATRSDHFFSRLLPGEDALTFETASHLYRLASQIYGMAPWRALQEDRLVFCRLKESDQLAMISIMGAGGEFVSVMVYLGAGGYHLFRQMSDTDMDPVDYHILRHSLHVEYTESSEMEKHDKDLLKAVGHPARGKVDGPVFRATRPGYIPWPVNEQEGRMLAEALAALIVFLMHLVRAKKNPWAIEGEFPVATIISDWRKEELRAEISTMEPPPEPEETLVMPRVDQERAGALAARAKRTKTWWEIDRFGSSMPIGEPNKRLFFAHCCMVADSGSGKILGIDVTGPETHTGDALVSGLLAAVEQHKQLPAEIWVWRPQHAELLAALGETLQVPVVLMAGLPAIDAAREGLNQFLATGAAG